MNCEEVSDEDAYNDAMNSYYHDVAVYEKRIADINAQTEVIQQQDRTLELRLNNLIQNKTHFKPKWKPLRKLSQRTSKWPSRHSVVHNTQVEVKIRFNIYKIHLLIHVHTF